MPTTPCGDDDEITTTTASAENLMSSEESSVSQFNHSESQFNHSESQFNRSESQFNHNFPRPLPVRRSELVSNLSSPIHSSYIVKDKIGQGTWGSVHVAIERVSGMERAVKKLPKKFTTEMSRFRGEISILKSVDHPNIARLYETFEDHANIYMVMEYCRGGELFEKIGTVRFFEEKEAAILMKQILSSVYYCHKKNISHRDLKPENFLFSDKSTKGPLKMIDFGLAKRVAPRKKMRTKVGTLYYVSPQVLQGNYDHSCDLWSAGVILYIMLCGCPPFNGATDAALILSVAKGDLEFKEGLWKERISMEARSLVSGLLDRDPTTRLTAEQALQHVWFTKVSPDPLHIIRSTSLPILKSGTHIDRRRSVLGGSCNRLDHNQLLLNFISLQTPDPCCALVDVGGHTPFCILSGEAGHRSMSTVSPPSIDRNDSLGAEDEIYQLGQIATELVPKWRRFAAMNQLKRTFLNLVAQQIGDSGPLKAYRSLFLALDVNGDGVLSHEELESSLETLGELQSYLVVQDDELGAREVVPDELLPKELLTLIHHVDLDGNGTVEYSEFLASCVDANEHLDAAACRAAFRVMDRDSDGRVSLNEIRAALGWSLCGFYPSIVKLEYGDRWGNANSNITDEKLVDDLLRDADRDGDGFLDFDDFMSCLTRPD